MKGWKFVFRNTIFESNTRYFPVLLIFQKMGKCKILQRLIVIAYTFHLNKQSRKKKTERITAAFNSYWVDLSLMELMSK